MLASAPWYTSGIFLSTILGVCGLIATILGIVVAYKIAAPKKVITYKAIASAPFISTFQGMDHGLRILRGDKELANPHFLEIRLSCQSRRDIPSSSFDQDRPLVIDVGVPITAILQVTFDPPERPFPKVTSAGSELKIGPDLLRKGLTADYSVLVDGSSVRLSHENPLGDVDMRLEVQDQGGGMSIKKVLTWASIIFVVYYVATLPASSAHVVHSIFNGLQSAGNALSKWVNSF